MEPDAPLPVRAMAGNQCLPGGDRDPGSRLYRHAPPTDIDAGTAAGRRSGFRVRPAVDQSQASGTGPEFHATATNRQRFQVHLDFGQISKAQGNLDAAVLEYQDALTVAESRGRDGFRPADQALAHRRMAGAFDRLGKFAQAEVHYKKAVGLSPKDPKIWNDAGYSYYLQGRLTDAERTLKTAMKLSPDDERIRVNLGLTLAALGRTEEAQPLLSVSNGDAIGHANLGYLLAASGQFDLARRQYETALAYVRICNWHSRRWPKSICNNKAHRQPALRRS